MRQTGSWRLNGLAMVLGLWAGTSEAFADARAELLAAANRLANAKSYSWASAVDLDGLPFKPGPTTGRRVNGGYTWVSSEMLGTTTEAFLLGTNGLVKVEGDWKTEADLPKPGGPGAGSPGAGGPGRSGFGGMAARRLLQTKAPHEAAALFAERIKELKGKELKPGDHEITGELPDDLVRELTAFGRRGRGGSAGGGPSTAKGWLKVKLSDGQIVKTILEIESEIRTPDGGTQTLNAITTTEIKAVDSTTLEVPDAVKSKLSR